MEWIPEERGSFVRRLVFSELNSMTSPLVAQLIAQGKTFENRWRRSLPDHTPTLLGRSVSLLSVAWDPQVSRQHARLTLTGQHLAVEVLEEARNPVFFRGQVAHQFTVKPGEHFVIGETTFTFFGCRAMATLDLPQPISQRTFSHQFIEQIRYRDADRRIGVLNRLPDVISSAVNEDDLMNKMVNTLMAGISTAGAIGIVRIGSPLVDPHESAVGGVESDEIEVKHWDMRSIAGGDFAASARLIQAAISSQQTVLHFWDRSTVQENSGYTFDARNDWAFACPLDSSAFESPESKLASENQTQQIESSIDSGWAIYVTGKSQSGLGAQIPGLMNPQADLGSGELDIEGDIKFCELIAATLKNLMQLRHLQRRQESLRHFFSPAVLHAFARRAPDEVLQPRQCEVSVLFCDLRGFAKTSEAMANDLLSLLDHVSRALGVMTKVILDHAGVIGDFHGDAAMGFWGWPFDQADAVERAVKSAIEIQRQLTLFNRGKDVPWEMGIGIGTGLAVAGRIGTVDQGKVTAFGPVVNLASRLEGMSKTVGASILIDGATARALRAVEDQTGLGCPVALATIKPVGIDKPVDVYRLEPQMEPATGQVIDDLVAHFTNGQWDQTRALIERVSHDSPDDSTCRLISAYLEQHPQKSGLAIDEAPHVIKMVKK